jgi:N-acetylglutamate synthase-like GNAT family acetyltransferase
MERGEKRTFVDLASRSNARGNYKTDSFDFCGKQKAEGGRMIRKCEAKDFEALYEIINDAAQAYKGVIPADRWHEPYMTKEELRREIQQGVEFWGYEKEGIILGVMGLQNVQDVTLIRHAYVRTDRRRSGFGGELLLFLLGQTTRPVLIGTWASATWAVAFYQKHGFIRVSEKEKNFLLKKYWTIPERQVETSVVLADVRWISGRAKDLRFSNSDS